MQQAYGIRDFQISGAPNWTSTERYDITAKAEDEATQEDLKPMLQALLETALEQAGVRVTSVAPQPVSLEDVFVALMRRGGTE